MKDQQESNLPGRPSLYPQEDEISLTDLFRVLVNYKLMIFCLTALTTLVTIIYVLSLPSVYEAKSILFPPTEKQILPFNIQDVPNLSKEFSVGNVFKTFKQNLFAQTTRRQVFKKMNLLKVFAGKSDKNTITESVFSSFNERLIIKTTNEDEVGTKYPISAVSLSMEGTDPELISEIINRVVQAASENTISEIIGNIDAAVAVKKKKYGHDIQMLIEQALKKRKNRIEVLSEQAKIARTLGIIDPWTGKV